MKVDFSIDKAASVKEEIKERYNIFTNEINWVEKNTKNDSIKAFISNDKKIGYPSVRCKVEVNCSAEELYNFLVKDILETAGKWNPAFLDATVLEQLNENEQVLAMYYQKPPARAREDLFYRIFGFDGKSYFERSIGIVNHPQIPKPKKNVVRSGLFFCTKDIHIVTENTCLYDVIWQYDPKGKVSKFLPNSIVTKLVLGDLLGELDKLQKKYI